MTAPVLAGAEAWSHEAAGDRGALVLHGFTGNPSSMRGLAEAFSAAGYHVEMPRLPGHGTTLDDMFTTSWADWSSEADAAYGRLAARTRVRVVAGLSMGGSLTLWLAGRHPEIAGLICVNPLVQPPSAELLDVFEGALAEGTTVLPGIGSDIADPDVMESAYDGTPVAGLLSLVHDGVDGLASTYSALAMPMLLLTSPQDHVVEPTQAEFLVAHYAGNVERVSLERSYHVATQDYDKDLIFTESVAFADRVTT